MKQLVTFAAFLLVASPVPAGTNETPVTITRITVNANQTELEWHGGIAPYRIPWRTDLASESWAEVGGATSDTNRLTIVNESKDFFRVVADGAAAETARYEVIFNSTWSRSTHPIQFPSGAHYSGLIGGTHNTQFSMWMPGALATAGIEQMAEIAGFPFAGSGPVPPLGTATFRRIDN